MQMTVPFDSSPRRTVVIVADDVVQRASMRSTLLDSGVHLLECGRDELGALARAVHIDLVLAVGGRNTAALLLEAFDGASSSPRRLCIVHTRDDARRALEKLVAEDALLEGRRDQFQPIAKALA